jgi:hypothetical protein
MKYDSDDALDRALFALPLEEPPDGLRAAILTTTVYRPAPPFAAWEVASVGALVAIGVWFCVLIALGGGSLFVHSIATIGQSTTHALSNAGNLAWAAVGVATAAWLTLFTGSQPFALAGQRFGRRGNR